MDYVVDDILTKLSDKVDYSEVYLDTEKVTEISVLNDAINYANTYFDIQNPGTPNARVVYKSPEKIYQQNIQQMLLD